MENTVQIRKNLRNPKTNFAMLNCPALNCIPGLWFGGIINRWAVHNFEESFISTKDYVNTSFHGCFSRNNTLLLKTWWCSRPHLTQCMCAEITFDSFSQLLELLKEIQDNVEYCRWCKCVAFPVWNISLERSGILSTTLTHNSTRSSGERKHKGCLSKLKSKHILSFKMKRE